MKLSLLSIFVILILFSSGCANLDAQKIQLNQSKICCTDYSGMNYSSISVEGAEVEIIEEDTVYDFPLGRSRFRAFVLPKNLATSAELAVQAIRPVMNVFANGKTWSPYFHPAITYLDERWKVLETINQERPPAWCEGSSCSGVLVVSRIPANAKYFVVHTPIDKVGAFRVDTQRHNGLTLPAAGGFVSIPGGVGERRSVGYATGRLKIFIHPN